MDLHEFRNSRRRKTDNLLKEDHRDLKRFFALDSAAYRDLTAQGGLDEKTKELLGLVASTVLRCNDCIAYHCDRCVEVGWKKAELLDALNVALVVGGSITIPHIRTVWEVVEQLYDEQVEKVKAPERAKALDHAAHEVKAGAQERKPSRAALTAGLTPAAAAPPPSAMAQSAQAPTPASVVTPAAPAPAPSAKPPRARKQQPAK
ncbi:MAG: hypothetical protein QOJ26_839 [Thermoplasmata archaeon]|nr:hypothetical protein [Thermoplasmata archaeon]